MSTAGPNAPGTMANDTAVGTDGWSLPNNAKVSDNTHTTATGSSTADSNYLKATNFGFAIPSGATINGVTVSIERKFSSAPNTAKDKVVKLVKGGTVSGNNKADTGTNWPSTDTVKTYGGAADLWGLTLTDTDTNASTFGVVLQIAKTVSDGKSGTNAYVDFISITIDYTTGGGGGGLSIPVASQSYRQRRIQ